MVRAGRRTEPGGPLPSSSTHQFPNPAITEIRMNHIAPLREPLIREVPLSRLALAPRTCARRRPIRSPRPR